MLSEEERSLSKEAPVLMYAEFVRTLGEVVVSWRQLRRIDPSNILGSRSEEEGGCIPEGIDCGCPEGKQPKPAQMHGACGGDEDGGRCCQQEVRLGLGGGRRARPA